MVNKTRIAALLLLPVIILPVAGCAGNKAKSDTAYVARDVNTLYSEAKSRLDRGRYGADLGHQRVVGLGQGAGTGTGDRGSAVGGHGVQGQAGGQLHERHVAHQIADGLDFHQFDGQIGHGRPE